MNTYSKEIPINRRTALFQGFRVMFILAIVFMHAGYPFLGKGADLCSFFFVLSGFLYKRKYNDSFKDYFVKKLKYVFPIYWFCLGFYTIISCFGEGFDLKLRFLPHLFLLQSLVPIEGCEYYFEYVGTSWFLSSLLFCYFLSPFLSKIEIKMGCKLGMVLALVILSFLYFNDWGEYRVWFTYISPLFRLCEYFMGICLCDLLSKIELRKSNFCLDICFIITYLLLLHYHIFANMSSILHVIAIAYLYVMKSSAFISVFGNRYIVSFSKYIIFIYLSHMVIFVPLSKYSLFSPLYTMIISIFISCIIAYLYFGLKRLLLGCFASKI